MELDPRAYARYQLNEDALKIWRKHSCLSRLSRSQREDSYAAAKPLLEAVARNLVQQHSWTEVAPPTDAALFCIQRPGSAALFTLPHAYAALFAHAQPGERMFDALFDVRLNPDDGRLYVAEPLADLFHLLQLLVPGCLTLVKAEYVTHEVDDDGEVAWITWRTFVRALPPADWMDLHARQSPQLVDVVGESRWATLRRAAADLEVLAGGDITFG